MNKKSIFVVIFIVLVICGLGYATIRENKDIENKKISEENTNKDKKETTDENEVNNEKKDNTKNNDNENKGNKDNENENNQENIEVGEYKQPEYRSVPISTFNIEGMGYENGELDFIKDINIPTSWDKNYLGYKKPNVKENISTVKEKFDEYYSSKEKFMEFDPATVSENVTLNYIIAVKRIQNDPFPEEMGEFSEIIKMSLPETYPCIRFDNEKIEQIKDLSFENLQPFEMLIREGQVEDFKNITDKLSLGLSKYLREKDPTYLSYLNDDEYLVKFYPYVDNQQLPNGQFCPEGYYYAKVNTVFLTDEKLMKIMEDKGFKIGR